MKSYSAIEVHQSKKAAGIIDVSSVTPSPSSMSGFALQTACQNLLEEVGEAKAHFKNQDPIFDGVLQFLSCISSYVSTVAWPSCFMTSSGHCLLYISHRNWALWLVCVQKSAVNGHKKLRSQKMTMGFFACFIIWFRFHNNLFDKEKKKSLLPFCMCISGWIYLSTCIDATVTAICSRWATVRLTFALIQA